MVLIAINFASCAGIVKISSRGCIGSFAKFTEDNKIAGEEIFAIEKKIKVLRTGEQVVLINDILKDGGIDCHKVDNLAVTITHDWRDTFYNLHPFKTRHKIRVIGSYHR